MAITARALVAAALTAAAATCAANAQTGERAASATTPDRAAELVDTLAGEDPRGRAFAELLQLGPPAAAAALTSVRAIVPTTGSEPPSRQLTRCLQLLVELGPAATDTIDGLLAAADGAQGEAARQLLDCVLSIAPHTGEGAAGIVTSARPMLHDLMTDDSDEELQQRCAETWFRSVQLGVMNGSCVHGELTPSQLLAIAGELRTHTFRTEMAAVMLSYQQAMTADDRAAALGLLREHLGHPPERPTVTTSSGNLTIRYACGPRSQRRYAAAMLRLATAAADRVQAHAYLLAHGLPHERWRAIEQLRGQPDLLPGCEGTLRELAADPKTEQLLRYELVTTLGMLPRLAPESLSALRQLADTDDKALAARVRAALRGSETGR